MEVIASPMVRIRALRSGIDLAALAERLGRSTIVLEDLAPCTSGAGAGPAAGPGAGPAAEPGSDLWDVDHAAWGPVRTERLGRFARLAAGNLAAAQALVPAVTHHDRADLTEIEAFRRSLAEGAGAGGPRLTALAFHIRALARTLLSFPRFNASLTADGGTLVLKDYVHVGIAVDAPHGLMVPVVRDADRLGLRALAEAIADCSAKARARRLAPSEMGGASMTISSLGGIGGTGFTPIVNPPEVAILGISRAELAPVWTGEAFAPRLMAPLSLTYDHRVVNGAEAARFLSHYARLLADPRRLV